MKKIVCGKDNAETFRGELKAATPDFYTLARQLYTSGMISGLRGATLETGLIEEQEIIEPSTTREVEKTCEDCGQWQRDTLGDGTGIGQCLLNIKPTQVKWPGIPACNKFEESVWL